MSASSANNTSTGSAAAAPDLLRAQEIEYDRLKIENFNLKLHVSHLEERFLDSPSIHTEDFVTELVQIRDELRRKDAKIYQQRENCLQAVSAIDQLKQQVAEAHRELEVLRAQSSQADVVVTMSQGNQHVEAEHQDQIKRTEDRMQAEIEKLKQDSDKYRNEYITVAAERDRLQSEREHLAAELETAKQEKSQAWECIAMDLARLKEAVESARLENAELSAGCDRQKKPLERDKSECASASDTIHGLEREVSEWKTLGSEREVALKTLELRCQDADAEVKRLEDRLEAATTEHDKTTNERFEAREQVKSALKAQNADLRANASSLEHQLQSFTAKCQSYKTQLHEEDDKVKKYMARIVAAEHEQHQWTAHSEQLENEVSQLKKSLVSERVRAQQQLSEQITRITNERNRLDTLMDAKIKDLLDAVDILTNGIGKRDKQIQALEDAIKQLQRSRSLVVVKEQLLEQLAQTKQMVNETFKREVSRSDESGWGVRLDDNIGRLEKVCDGWREHVQEARETHRRYGEAWRTAAVSFGKGKKYPVWVHDIERSCSQQLNESVRVSELWRGIVQDFVDALDCERKQRRCEYQQRPLASLVRIGDEVNEVEQQIKTYPDE